MPTPSNKVNKKKTRMEKLCDGLCISILFGIFSPLVYVVSGGRIIWYSKYSVGISMITGFFVGYIDHKEFNPVTKEQIESNIKEDIEQADRMRKRNEKNLENMRDYQKF